MNTEHLAALINRLGNERARLRDEKPGSQGEALRKVWIKQIEAEIAAEEKFLGMTPCENREMTDDEIFAELGI